MSPVEEYLAALEAQVDAYKATLTPFDLLVFETMVDYGVKKFQEEVIG